MELINKKKCKTSCFASQSRLKILERFHLKILERFMTKLMVRWFLRLLLYNNKAWCMVHHYS